MTISASTAPLLLLPLAIPAVLIFFLQVRPRRRAERELTLLQNGLRVGDRVATRGGLHATVADLTTSTVTLDVCGGLTHCCDRDAIARLLETSTAGERQVAAAD